ncbi:MAG: hypothetical protein FK733_01535 [Asgard group archaeon]|nr:hypothetical protein [Asgard group archaeon]
MSEGVEVKELDPDAARKKKRNRWLIGIFCIALPVIIVVSVIVVIILLVAGVFSLAEAIGTACGQSCADSCSDSCSSSCNSSTRMGLKEAVVNSFNTIKWFIYSIFT